MGRRDEFFLAEVVEATRITPNMVRVRFGGEELTGFESSGMPDERLGVYFPNPGERQPQRPTIVGGMWSFPDEDNAPEARSYTVRRFSPEQGQMLIDFVVHDGGVASAWALQARPGMIVGLSTAGGWYRPPVGTTHQLLVGDATALPAIGRILEELPSGTTATVIVEVPEEADRQSIDSAAAVEYTWLVGSGMGRAPSRLEEAVRATPLPAHGTYAWVAAEAAVTRAIRKYLRKEAGLGGAGLTVLGYWRAHKEEFLSRYRPVEEQMLGKYAALASSGIEGQDLIDAWDAELERSGF